MTGRQGQRILIAGVGNIFLGDDAFGVEVAQRLARRPLPDGVRVVDFGIRGFDLAFALQESDETVILVDALPRGEAPGTISVLEPDFDEWRDLDERDAPEMAVETHAMDPVKVLHLARTMGGLSTAGVRPNVCWSSAASRHYLAKTRMARSASARRCKRPSRRRSTWSSR